MAKPSDGSLTAVGVGHLVYLVCYTFGLGEFTGYRGFGPENRLQMTHTCTARMMGGCAMHAHVYIVLQLGFVVPPITLRGRLA